MDRSIPRSLRSSVPKRKPLCCKKLPKRMLPLQLWCTISGAYMNREPIQESENLAELLRQRRAATTIELAEIIAAFPDLEQRYREARREIYMAMSEYALGRLTDTERSRILTVLRPVCPELFVGPPQSPADSQKSE